MKCQIRQYIDHSGTWYQAYAWTAGSWRFVDGSTTRTVAQTEALARLIMSTPAVVKEFEIEGDA